MPTLEWIGKEKVINHDKEVPFKMLEAQYTFDASGRHEGAADSGNMIIHGDNLLALKALLPKYQGKVKCIYIDPPYNTGNEGWVYNDKVSDPQIKKWLGEVVGKEDEDLSRHDKWLCMMYPRLKLLQQLLADDGAIFISIDDNELYFLKSVCDEIFGSQCFVANISWQRTYSTRNDSKGIPAEVEYLLVYSKNIDWQPKKLPRTAGMDSKYKNVDNDVEAWTSDNPFAPGAATHQGMVYAIQHPFTGEYIYPSSTACWRYQQDEMLRIMQGWGKYVLRNLHDEEQRATICGISPNDVRKDVKGIVLAVPLDEARKFAETVYKRGQWPKFYFTKGGLGGIRRKTYFSAVGGKLATNYWPYADVGHTDEAKKELKGIYEGKVPFDTPKPTRLIERILQIASEPDSIILDSFAGSGTTAHAVLSLNKKDKGNRKFILIEMMDYADSITAERVKRVINGYGEGDKRAEGAGGSFTFYELGEPLFDEDGNLNAAVSAEKIREYVWYMETKQPLPKSANQNATAFLGENGTESETQNAIAFSHRNENVGATQNEIAKSNQNDNAAFLGVCNHTAYYFHYNPDNSTTLDNAFLASVQTRAESYVIYADACALSEAFMAKHHITFKKIPRDIERL